MEHTILRYDYSKVRREFEGKATFANSLNDKDNVVSIDGSEDSTEQWMPQTRRTLEIDCVPQVAEHEVNTTEFNAENHGTLHVEAAWPTDSKTNDVIDPRRYIRKQLGDQDYQHAVMEMARAAETVLAQNNTIDLYQQYFDSGPAVFGAPAGSNKAKTYSLSNVPPSCKTVSVFRDPNKIKRAATKIAWHPDSRNRVAVAYSCMDFQRAPEGMPLQSYIWDINSPNKPQATVEPKSALTCIKFNPRSPEYLAGGMYDGLVGFWDLRKGKKPLSCSTIQHSHRDPVYDLFWIQSRGANIFCSVSTDGNLLWWDLRNLKGPMDGMVMEPGPKTLGLLKPAATESKESEGAKDPVVFGGTAMEYRADAGATRYLIGTEQGTVCLCDRKTKKDSDSVKVLRSVYGMRSGKHHGPIYSIQRNPLNPKFFMTVGDWTVRLWMEDHRTPIISTPHDQAYLTAGCWSPTRPGVFFTCKNTGMVDGWDLFHKQNAPTFSTKVGDAGLVSLSVQHFGRHLAVGSADGTVTVLELSEGLCTPQLGEKATISAMLERETNREKHLAIRQVARARELKEKQRQEAASKQTFDVTAPEDEETKKQLQSVEDAFLRMIESDAGKRGTGTEHKTNIA